MRKILIASSVFFFFFLYGLVTSQFHVGVLPDELEPKNHPGLYDYRGVTNVHTNRGTGSGSPPSVIREAQEANLDFLFLTDLNPFGPLFEETPTPEGYYRKLLVMAGSEFSYLESRLLAYDLDRRHALENLGQAQVLLADLLSQTGSDAQRDLIVMAHPKKPGYSWSGPFPPGLDGIEVINLKSVWQQAWSESKISFLWSLFIYPFNSQLALLRLYDEPQAELALWDQLSRQRPTVGFAGSEATAKTSPVGSFFLRFPSYQTSFGLVTNHVLLKAELTGEAESDRKKILKAMSDGQFYMSLDLLGNPKGFAAFVQDGEKTHLMGSRVKWAPGMKIVVHLPKKPKVPFEAAFIKDGQHVMSSNSTDTEFEVHGPGVYRVIVRVFMFLTLPDGQRWTTWIYTNPFYVE